VASRSWSTATAVPVGARTLLLLTDVDGVYRDFGTPRQTRIDRLDATGAWKLLADGQVARGSMAPKVEAAAAFADFGGTTMIGSLDQVGALLAGDADTVAGPLAAPRDRPVTVTLRRNPQQHAGRP
jgi:carbamate kinase